MDNVAGGLGDCAFFAHGASAAENAAGHLNIARNLLTVEQL